MTWRPDGGVAEPASSSRSRGTRQTRSSRRAAWSGCAPRPGVGWRVRPTHASFNFGPEREAYERRLPPEVQDVVATELLAYPGSSRHFLKERVYDSLLANGAVELDLLALRERVRAIVKAIRTGACSTGS